MGIQWFHWAVLGILLMLMELIVPAFVMIWFGFAALLVGFTLSIFPGLSLVSQLQLWSIFSAIALMSWFQFFKPNMHKKLMAIAPVESRDETGVLANDVSLLQKGQVRFEKPFNGSDVWGCMSDETIKAGSRVKIIGRDGNILKVAAVER